MYFNGLDGLFTLVGWLLAIFVPLGAWKMVEIVIWLWHHIQFV